MRKLLFAGIITIMVAGCSEPAPKEETAANDKGGDMKALYEKNLTTVKDFIADFEKEDIDAMGALIADTAVWNSPAYGDTVHTKKHWLESLKGYMDNWNDLHLTGPTFLPGLDSATHDFDGSVRYYGRWDGTHSSGIATKVFFYGTYEFNQDNKLISGSDYFDLGGLMNAVQPKK